MAEFGAMEAILGMWRVVHISGDCSCTDRSDYAVAVLYIPHGIARNVWGSAVGLVPIFSEVGRSDY